MQTIKRGKRYKETASLTGPSPRTVIVLRQAREPVAPYADYVYVENAETCRKTRIRLDHFEANWAPEVD